MKPVICVMPMKQLFEVHKVCRAICELMCFYIKFPDAAGETNYNVQFSEYGHFSEVISYIDGCHVLFKCPSTLMLSTRTVRYDFLLLFSVYALLFYRDYPLPRFNSLSKLFIVCLISEHNIVDHY